MSVIYTIKLAVPHPASQFTTTITINVTSLGAMQQTKHYAQCQGWQVIETGISHTSDTLDEVKTTIEQHMIASGVRWQRLPRRVP